MSDQHRYQLDDHDEILSVHSEELVDDAARAELYKHMAFEADRSLKAAEAELGHARAALRACQERLAETRRLARSADDDLANFQNLGGKHWIHNARSTLTEAGNEGWE